MMDIPRARLPLFAALCALWLSCSTSFDGVRLRGQAPPMEEAARTIVVALQADGYTILEDTGRSLATDWRPLKEVEMREGDPSGGESMISVSIARRGALYDVFLEITIRRDGNEFAPESTDPIVIRWESILRELIREESREEG